MYRLRRVMQQPFERMITKFGTCNSNFELLFQLPGGYNFMPSLDTVKLNLSPSDHDSYDDTDSNAPDPDVASFLANEFGPSAILSDVSSMDRDSMRTISFEKTRKALLAAQARVLDVVQICQLDCFSFKEILERDGVEEIRGRWTSDVLQNQVTRLDIEFDTVPKRCDLAKGHRRLHQGMGWREIFAQPIAPCAIRNPRPETEVEFVKSSLLNSVHQVHSKFGNLSLKLL
ncbi:hypothetical protein PTKIN_Ptkin14bG0092900 [Pterospermum kingtungense]